LQNSEKLMLKKLKSVILTVMCKPPWGIANRRFDPDVSTPWLYRFPLNRCHLSKLFLSTIGKLGFFCFVRYLWYAMDEYKWFTLLCYL